MLDTPCHYHRTNKGLISYSCLFFYLNHYTLRSRLRLLFWTATCLVRPHYEVNILCNSADFTLFYPCFVRSPAFCGQFSVNILVAVQSRLYWICPNAIKHVKHESDIQMLQLYRGAPCTRIEQILSILEVSTFSATNNSLQLIWISVQLSTKCPLFLSD